MRGFKMTVGVQSADDITEDRVAAELASNGALSVLESQHYVPVVLEVARELTSELGDGPFVVTMRGIDNTRVAGERSVLAVEVTSRWTAPKAGAGVAPAPSPSAPAGPDSTQVPEGDPSGGENTDSGDAHGEEHLTGDELAEKGLDAKTDGDETEKEDGDGKSDVEGAQSPS